MGLYDGVLADLQREKASALDGIAHASRIIDEKQELIVAIHGDIAEQGRFIETKRLQVLELTAAINVLTDGDQP